MHTTPSKGKLADYGNDAEVILEIDESDMMSLTAREVHRIYAERTRAKVQTQIEDTLSDMLKLGKNVASNGIKTSSARFLERMVIELFNHVVAENVMSQSPEQWLQSATIIPDFVKRIVFNLLYLQPVAGFRKQHMVSTIDE